MPVPSAKPRITLYGPTVTPYTVKVARALRWKGLDFALVEPQSPADFRRWSSETGLLPVLDLDGVRVADSAAILDLLDERFPKPPLVSSDPRVAREQRRLEDWAGETFPFYVFRRFRARLGAAAGSGDEAGGQMARLGLIGPDGKPRREFFEASEDIGPEFERRLDDLEKLLGPRQFFFADQLGRADLAVFSFLIGMYTDLYAGGRVLLARHPGLVAHTERVDRATGGPGVAP
jgi:glutathione S-transferase